MRRICQLGDSVLVPRLGEDCFLQRGRAAGWSVAQRYGAIACLLRPSLLLKIRLGTHAAKCWALSEK